MATDKKAGKGGGVSFRSENAIESGLFSSGVATIKESIFAKYTYGGNAKPTPVWLVTYSREGEEDYEQPYSLGKGWKVSEDGAKLIALAGQTGLPKSCNAVKYLITPLEEALEAADLDPDDYLTGDPSLLDGLDVIVKRVVQEKREGLKPRKGEEEKERSILVIEEVTASEPASKSKGKAKGKKSADDDDEDEEVQPKKKGKPAADDDADDDEAEAAPKGKKKKPAATEDDGDDEDEAPAKGKTKGKAKPAADDDDANELDEEATEAIVAALEAADNEDIKVRDLGDALLKVLKGNPQRKAIVAHATDSDFLENETSWEFNGKVVSAK